jgi:hypothetical protein
MNAGTIFVLCLAAGLFGFVIYMAILSRRSSEADSEADKRKNGTNVR